MDTQFWRNAAGIVALSAGTMGLTVWLSSPGKLPDEALAVSTAMQQETDDTPSGSPSFGALAPSAAHAGVSGRWVGWMDVGGGEPVAFRFTLQEADGVVTGSATFPIGESAIEGGSIQGGQMSFVTRHRLASNGQLIATTISGALGDNSMELSMTSEGAVSRLLVNRASP